MSAVTIEEARKEATRTERLRCMALCAQLQEAADHADSLSHSDIEFGKSCAAEKLHDLISNGSSTS